MTFTRDLAWHNLDLLYRSSASYQFARYALGLSYKSLPEEVVHQARRCLLDALGCAIGAYDAPGRPICEAVARDLGGPPEATVFGSGFRTSAAGATLVNAFMVRFLDYNDIGPAGHNSDSIPSILAVAEREKAGGRELLTAIVISYELGARVNESFTDPAGMELRGMSSDIRGGLNVPPALGRLMEMSEEQIANAIGICASRCIPLSILDSNCEENSMTKNLRFGGITFEAIISCLLARHGFTGPVRVVEGDAGFREALLQGKMDLEKLVDFSGWRILKTRHKTLCANASSQGHISATLAIVREHDLKPEDIAAVRISASHREALHTTTLAKKYPRNAESADHSAFYANAIAIKERSFGPDSIKPEKFTDPVVLDLIEKITVEGDPSLSGQAGKSEIITTDGRRFEKLVTTPHGFGDDPLTDSELEDKFREMAEKHMRKPQVKKLIDTIWNIDGLDNVNGLARLMVFDKMKGA